MRNDLSLLKTLLPWNSPQELPLSFVYGGKTINGIPSDWNPSVSVRNIDCNITETTVCGKSPEGLEVRMECRTYHDFTAVEFVTYFTNSSDKDSPLMEDIRITGEIGGEEASLYHGNGDDRTIKGYEWATTPIESEPLVVEPCGDGTSCNGAFPYMRLLFDGRGVNLAVGWSGTWTSSFKKTSAGILVSVGQKRCHMVIRPGETMRTPSLSLLAYVGDNDMGINTWRKWYFAHIMPKQNGKPIEPKLALLENQIDGTSEHTGATEENQLAAIDGFIKAGFHPDVWWIDAGWYPCDFQWRKVGSLRHDPKRFPNGLACIGKKCKELGIEFLLWFEPERAIPGTDIYREHPEWLLNYVVDGEVSVDHAVNLAIPECCDYIIDTVDSLIKEYGVDIYRQDFNFKIGYYWEQAEEEDRIGAIENLHIQGYYRFWDELLLRNPGILLDSCAGGGRRNDIESIRRSIPLHYSDAGYGHHPVKLKQYRQMHEWLPYFRSFPGNFCAPDNTYDSLGREIDRFTYYVTISPSLTHVVKYNDSEEKLALAKEMQEIWRTAAEAMVDSEYYPLTECNKSSDEFYAAQFYVRHKNRGILHLVNGATAKETQFTLKLKGLNPSTTYILTSSETKTEWRYLGSKLMEGVPFTVPPKSGDVWTYIGR